MPTEKKNIRRSKKSPDGDQIDFDKPTRMDKTGFYLLIICGLLVLIGGIDMTFTGSVSSGWSPGGRFTAGRQGSITGPTAIVFGLILLSIPLYRQIKKYFKK
jgi:hypothetical protein